MNKTLSIIVSFLIVAVIITGVIFSVKSKQIPKNPAETIGNTSGNLNNNGYFCESDGVVYFTNTNDNHYLYRMDLDGSNAERIMDVPVSYINAGGDYLYFYYDDQGAAKFMGVSGNMHGIYRLLKTGKGDLTCLNRCVSGILSLIGNELYYEHYDNTEGMTLYRSSLDGKVKGQVVDAIVNPACVQYGNIYYPDQDNNFYLNVYRPGSSSGSLFLEEQMYNPTAVGNYIYYMKVDDNYRLYRYDSSSNVVTKITEDRIDAFNIHGDVIFYQRNQNPALIRVNSDGTDAVVIAEGNYKNINCTSLYTYFMPFESDTITYRTPTYGGSEYTAFP